MDLATDKKKLKEKMYTRRFGSVARVIVADRPDNFVKMQHESLNYQK